MTQTEDTPMPWTPPRELWRQETVPPALDPYNQDPYYPDPYAGL